MIGDETRPPAKIKAGMDKDDPMDVNAIGKGKDPKGKAKATTAKTSAASSVAKEKAAENSGQKPSAQRKKARGKATYFAPIQ